jgi:peptidoglycan hydrolase-like protein with peptidoglycan-binding domain
MSSRSAHTLQFGDMRRAALVVAAVLGVTLLTFAPGTSRTAVAAPTDVIAVVVEGTGNGHGRGMSQWGAYGWAVDRGWTSAQILDHYYGGTSSGSIGNPQVRVRLTALDGAATVGLVSHGGGVTVNVGTGPVTRASMKVERNAAGSYDIFGSTTVSCATSSTLIVPDGPLLKGAEGDAVRQVQQFLTVFGFDPGGVDGDFGNLTEAAVKRFQANRALPQDGQWRIEEATAARAMIASGSGATFTKIGTSATPTFTTTDTADAVAALGLCQPNGSVVHYRGSIAVSNQAGSTRVVNAVATEDYLRGVVPKEISASWAQAGGGRGAQAVMAQAVAARSYGALQNRYPPYATTCDTQSCQVYGGAATRSTATGVPKLVEDYRTDQAIADTAGIVRKWPNGSIVSTEFSASNGPRTAGGVFPPVDDGPGDGTAGNPNHRWTRILDADVLAARYGLGSLTGATMVEAASSVNRQFDGIWFNDVVLTGSNGKSPVRIPAWDFRGAHGLPSPGFTVRVITRDTVTSSAALIGDSVGNSIAGATTSEFRILTDGTFPSLRIDVLDSRFVTKTPPSPSGVQAAASVPTNTELAVVQLGYNPSTNPTADIDAMMQSLTARGVRHVAWVNLADIRTSGGTSVFAPTNAALNAARSRWPNLTVLDWNGASAGPERVRWFNSDGVHLTTTGQAHFALWLRQSLVSMSPAGAGRLAPPRRIEIPVAGRTVKAADGTLSTIPANVTAVSLNVAAVDPVSGGFMTVWPCSTTRPLTSNLNYTRGAIDGNGVIAPVDAAGKACVYSHVATDAVIDIGGWFGPPDASGSGFTAITPKRLVDSRVGLGVPAGRVRPQAPVTLPVVGAAVQRIDGTGVTVPANAIAAAINVTVVSPTAAGYITVWPCGVDRPVVSTINFAAGDIRANGAIAPLGAGGALCFYTHAPTDLVVDVVGWFTAGATASSSAFVPAVPQRWVDSRERLGSPTPIRPSQPLQVNVTGRQMVVGGQLVAIPADAESVSMNITAVNPPVGGFATVWPCGTPRPVAANLNYSAGRVTANNVIATIGAGGSVCIYTHTDTHFLVDVTGWFNRTDTFAAVVPDRVVDTRFGIGPAAL